MHPTHGAIAAQATERQERGLISSCIRGIRCTLRALLWVPMFGYAVLLYTLASFTVGDLSTTFFSIGSYSFTYIELIWELAALAGVAEILRVSHPGEDNTNEAMRAVVVAGIQVVLLTISITLKFAGTGEFLWLFNSGNFVMLLVISVAQSYAAVKVNARTLKRSFVDSDGGG
jgi:hypothetical protein